MPRPLHSLQFPDGRFVECYFWSTRRATFTRDQGRAWRGDQEAANKLRDEWRGNGSHTPQLVPFVLKRFFVHASFCDTIFSFQTWASSEEDAQKRYLDYFGPKQLKSVLSPGEAPHAMCVERLNTLREDWHGHEYSYGQVSAHALEELQGVA
jgi:hypothetical protein